MRTSSRKSYMPMALPDTLILYIISTARNRANLTLSLNMRGAALSGVMSNLEYSIPRALTLCQGNVEAVGSVVYLPIYTVMFIQHNTRRTGNDTYKFDLTGLA